MRFEILKKQPPEVFLKKSQNWKESIRVFSKVYFSTGVDISFQHSIYQVIWIWKICFHIALELFSLSINYNFVRT